jgi:hypothetical protein
MSAQYIFQFGHLVAGGRPKDHCDRKSINLERATILLRRHLEEGFKSDRCKNLQCQTSSLGRP